MKLNLNYKLSNPTVKSAWINWTKINGISPESNQLLLAMYDVETSFALDLSTRTFEGAEEDLLRFILEWA